MIEFLNNIDSQIFLFFNGMHLPFLDRFMVLFTGRFIWIPMYATILLLLIRHSGPRKAWLYAFGIGLAILLTDQLCASYIRPVIERLRPSNPANPLSEFTLIVNNYRGGPYGFPSCHSANSFALATFIAVLFRRRGLSAFIFGWAVLNSYTRLYLGVHYPGDLLVGAVIGSAIGYILCRICVGADRHFFSDRTSAEDARSASADNGLSRPLITIPYGFEWAGIGRRNTIGITAGDVLIGVGSITAMCIILVSLV